MNLGEQLYNLRKKKNLSQEEVAEKLNVTRQTISKWETGESKPDFDKIIPSCNLFEITSEELLSGKENVKETVKEKTSQINTNNKSNHELTKKRAILLSIGIFLYFISVVSIIICEETGINSVIGISIFLVICGLATSVIVYQGIVYSERNKVEVEQENPKLKITTETLAIIFLIIYLIISFSTMAWHITWIIWLIYAVIENIIKILFELGGKKNGK